MPMTVQTFSRGTCYAMAQNLPSYSAQSIVMEYVIVQQTIQRMLELNAMVCKLHACMYYWFHLNMHTVVLSVSTTSLALSVKCVLISHGVLLLERLSCSIVFTLQHSVMMEL